MFGTRNAWRMGLALASTSVLAACASVPDLGPRPSLATPASLAAGKSFEAPAQAWPTDQWWKAYGDPELDRLIEEGLAGSPSLAAAAARLRQAQAAAEQTGAALKPSINAQGSAQASRMHLGADGAPAALSGIFPDEWKTRANASLGLDYQLDFFGRNRAALAAATSQAQAARAEEAAARLELATAIALTYADLQRLQADRAAALDVVRLREDSAALVAQRLKSGLENEGQANQSVSEAANAHAEVAALDGAIAKTRNALAGLVGKGPDRGLEIPLPTHPTLTARGLPANAAADLIGRRPDLAAARMRAEAAASRIDVAKADFYPNVSLSAVVGLQTLSGGTLSFGQVGPAISLPIFSGGRLEGAYRGKRAEYDEAVALYDQALTTAFRDVADALADRRALDAQLGHTRQALAAAEAAYGVARTRYQGGLVSYADTLSVENGLVAQRRAAADLEARAFALDVALVRALGGGFTQS